MSGQDPYPGVPPPMSPAHRAMLDKAAQQQGFRDYNSYYAFDYQRNQQHTGSVGSGSSAPTPTPAPAHAPAPANHLNSLSGVWNYLSQALGGR